MFTLQEKLKKKSTDFEKLVTIPFMSNDQGKVHSIQELKESLSLYKKVDENNVFLTCSFSNPLKLKTTTEIHCYVFSAMICSCESYTKYQLKIEFSCILDIAPSRRKGQ